jgi:hypothetical protein
MMRMSRLLAAVLVLVITATVVVGCGGSAPPPPPPPSGVDSGARQQLSVPHGKKAYIKQADQMCTQAHVVARNGNLAVQNALKSGGRGAALQAIKQFAPIYEQIVVQMEQIKPPVRDRERLKPLMHLLIEQVRSLGVYAQALENADTKSLEALRVLSSRIAKQARREATRYGFTVCGR